MSSSITTSIAKLEQLRTSGVLSDEEYKAKKASIVDAFLGLSSSAQQQQQQPAAPFFPHTAAASVATTSSSGREYPADTGERIMCSVHNKMRSLSTVMQTGVGADGSPIYVCTPRYLCKVGPSREMRGGGGDMRGGGGGDMRGGYWPEYDRPVDRYYSRPAPYPRRGGGGALIPTPPFVVGGSGGRGGGGGSRAAVGGYGRGGGYDEGFEKQLCSIHGKLRSMSALTQSNGQWTCRADSLCKTRGSEYFGGGDEQQQQQGGGYGGEYPY